MIKLMLNIINSHKSRDGFTIVELLVVVVIIGVLAGITIVSYTGISHKATIASIQSDLANDADLIKVHQAINSAYPSSITDCPSPATGNLCLKLSGDNRVESYTYDDNTKTFRLNIKNGNECYSITESSPPTTCAVAVTPQTFSYNGDYQTYTVPAGVTTLTMEVWGAQGGGDLGGKGGYAKGVISVTPGEVLRVYVGGQGQSCYGYADCMLGGFNGGGNSSGSDIESTGYGGGGATDIRRSPYGLNNRIIVAGGGGAMGGDASYGWQIGAGGDGGQTGGNGLLCPDCSGSPLGGVGGGATQSAGGIGGTGGVYFDPYPGPAGSDGTFGIGADSPGCWWAASGPGGGGYYGGGSGGCPGQHGGGGGSSWVLPGATNVTYTTGARSGNGQAKISG